MKDPWGPGEVNSIDSSWGLYEEDESEAGPWGPAGGHARMEQWAGSGWGLLTKLKLSCEWKAYWKVDGQEGQPWGLAVIRAGEQSKGQTMIWKQ